MRWQEGRWFWLVIATCTLAIVIDVGLERIDGPDTRVLGTRIERRGPDLADTTTTHASTASVGPTVSTGLDTTTTTSTTAPREVATGTTATTSVSPTTSTTRPSSPTTTRPGTTTTSTVTTVPTTTTTPDPTTTTTTP